MLRAAAIALGLLGVTLAACGSSREPRIRALPKPDGAPSLRGGGPPRSPRNASYQIAATLDAVRHTITATETLTWTNTGASAVDVLPFHLYLNAFKNDQTVFMRESRGSMRGATASANGWGWERVDSVQIDGVELVSKLRLPGEQPGAKRDPLADQTVVELPLAQPIGPGATVQVHLKFTDQLPEVFERTGYRGDFTMVGQWFPKIGVRTGAPGAEVWACAPFHAFSEFFADFGVYDVALTVPATHVVAATGVLVAATETPSGTRTFTYHAEDVHDFAWMADPYMNVLTGQARPDDGPPVDVRVYYRGPQKDFAYRHLEAAIGTIERMSKWFYPYPWSTMTVIDPPPDAAAEAGGMEYPTLVTTEGDTVLARPGIRLPEYVTVHEVGHNWFQGLLASNEVDEAWLDEGVNEWADGRVMDDLYGARGSFVDWMGWQGELDALRRAVASDPASIPSPIASASYAFVDFDAYGEATYTSTSRALRTLELTVGPTKFAAAMMAYAHAFAFKHPTGRDLFDTLGRELGTDLRWFFGPVFEEVGGLHLGVREKECHAHHPPRGVFDDGSGGHRIASTDDAPDDATWRCSVIVQNTGTIHVPVDVALKFADGSEDREVWDDRGRESWKLFQIDRSSKLSEVVLDPEHKIQLDQPLRHAVRVDGDGAAAMRAAAWVGSVTQTLMQVVGP